MTTTLDDLDLAELLRLLERWAAQYEPDAKEIAALLKDFERAAQEGTESLKRCEAEMRAFAEAILRSSMEGVDAETILKDATTIPPDSGKDTP